MTKFSTNGNKGNNFIANSTLEWFNEEVEVCSQRIWVGVKNMEQEMIFLVKKV